MIRYKELPEDKTIEIFVGNKITNEGYDVMFKQFKTALSHWDEIRFLEVVEDFKGIEALALWKDIKFALSEFKTINTKLRKCAIVADQKWIKVVTNCFEPLIQADIRFFKPDELIEARAWLKL